MTVKLPYTQSFELIIWFQYNDKIKIPMELVDIIDKQYLVYENNTQKQFYSVQNNQIQIQLIDSNNKLLTQEEDVFQITNLNWISETLFEVTISNLQNNNLFQNNFIEINQIKLENQLFSNNLFTKEKIIKINQSLNKKHKIQNINKNKLTISITNLSFYNKQIQEQINKINKPIGFLLNLAKQHLLKLNMY